MADFIATSIMYVLMVLFAILVLVEILGMQLLFTRLSKEYPAYYNKIGRPLISLRGANIAAYKYMGKLTTTGLPKGLPNDKSCRQLAHLLPRVAVCLLFIGPLTAISVIVMYMVTAP